MKHGYHAIAIDEQRKSFKPDLWTKLGDKNQVVEQMWFVGVHSNIGGSYRNKVLSDITLNWMVECAENCGLEFKKHLKYIRLAPISEGRIENSYSTLYKILPGSPYDREIGKGINERVHRTAIDAVKGGHFIDYRRKPAEQYYSENLVQTIKDGLKGH